MVGQARPRRLTRHGTRRAFEHGQIRYGALMNIRKRIEDTHQTATNLLDHIREEAQSRHPNDDIARLSYECGYLSAIIRNLMIDLELSKDEVPNLPRESKNA